MKRIHWIIAAVLGVMAGTAWIYGQRAGTGSAGQRPVDPPATVAAGVIEGPAAVNGAAAPLTPASMETLIADVNGGDAGKRAAAIVALGKAPRAQAVPVLQRVLMDGEPEVDRPLALRSLRELALGQGDADGAIRDAIRGALYHGDDFTKMADVQNALDVIEESEMR